jgi:hypothetical protein
MIMFVQPKNKDKNFNAKSVKYSYEINWSTQIIRRLMNYLSNRKMILISKMMNNKMMELEEEYNNKKK